MQSALPVTISVIYAANNNVEHHDEVNINRLPQSIPLSSNRYTPDDLTPVTENPFVKLDGNELLGVEPSSGLAFMSIRRIYLFVYTITKETIFGLLQIMIIYIGCELYDPMTVISTLC